MPLIGNLSQSSFAATSRLRRVCLRPTRRKLRGAGPTGLSPPRTRLGGLARWTNQGRALAGDDRSGETLKDVAGGFVQRGLDPGAHRVAVLLPLAQGQIAAQLGEADGLANRTLALLARSVALLTALGAYRLADPQLSLWYLPAAGMGLAAGAFFRALLPGPGAGALDRAAGTRARLPDGARNALSWFRPWGSNRLDTGQPPEDLYEGVRQLSELEADRYVLGTLQDAVAFNRRALRWQSHLLARAEIALVGAAVLGGAVPALTTVVA